MYFGVGFNKVGASKYYNSVGIDKWEDSWYDIRGGSDWRKKTRRMARVRYKRQLKNYICTEL